MWESQVWWHRGYQQSGVNVRIQLVIRRKHRFIVIQLDKEIGSSEET